MLIKRLYGQRRQENTERWGLEENRTIKRQERDEENEGDEDDFFSP